MKLKKPIRIDEELAVMIIKRIKQLRHDNNYTQEYVIDQTSLDIGRFETGASIPTVMSLAILCNFYSITLDEFFAPLNYPPKK